MPVKAMSLVFDADITAVVLMRDMARRRRRYVVRKLPSGRWAWASPHGRVFQGQSHLEAWIAIYTATMS